MINIATIIGARPQIIKSSIFLSELLNYKKIKNYLIHTGQHYDFNMSDVFHKQLNIKKPYVNLNINKKSSLNNISKIILLMEQILIKLKIDYIVIFGDTDTTLAAAIVAKKMNIKLIHVEAGLRNFDSRMPEEQNRIVADHYSDMLITPNKIATRNLIKENINKTKIYQLGDIMFDVWKKNKLSKNFQIKLLNKLQLNKEEYALITMHRQSNLKNYDRIKRIFKELSKLKLKIIFPIHPRTSKVFKKNKIVIPQNIIILKPLGYLEIKALLLNCSFVMTDSGGMQKEAYFAHKNSFILRSNTEWIELVKNKFAVLIKNDYKKLLKNINFNKNFNHNFYGNGNTSKKLIKLIIKNANKN